MIQKFRKQEEIFDERQLQIQGRVFKRGYLILLCLVLLNGYLGAWGVVWAEAFWQNLIVVMLATTIMSVEFIINGVYFGKNMARPWAIVALGFIVIMGIFGNAMSLASGARLIENNALTGPACTLVVTVLATIIGVTCIAKYIYDIKQEKGEN